MTRANFNCN